MFSVENRKIEFIEMLRLLLINSIMLAFIVMIIRFTYDAHFTRSQSATNRGK